IGHSVLKKWPIVGGFGKMSLAERLKNSGSENEAARNYRAAKIFQCTLFGEPETVEEVEIQEPVTAVPELKPLTDPRPDLAEDSELWTRFLQLAEDENKQLTGILHGFRCRIPVNCLFSSSASCRNL